MVLLVCGSLTRAGVNQPGTPSSFMFVIPGTSTCALGLDLNGQGGY